MNAFEVTNVFKHYGSIKALDGVTLKAPRGKIFGLLGPNGAGKTTLLRMLSTLLEPDRGTVKILGVDAAKEPNRVRELIGLAGQYAAVDEYLTGYENIYMTGRLYHLNRKETKSRTSELLEKLNLTNDAHRPVRTYSGGMRRRLDLGASLIGEPKVLFLDEPTTGLDPKTRLELWEIIRDLVKKGTSILLTTQYLEEADDLADHIAVLNTGRVIAEGTSDELKDKLGGEIVEFGLKNPKHWQKALSAVQGFARPGTNSSFEEVTQRVRLPVKEGAKSLAGIVQALNETLIPIESITLHRPSLDDVFLSLTSHEVEKDPKK